MLRRIALSLALTRLRIRAMLLIARHPSYRDEHPIAVLIAAGAWSALDELAALDDRTHEADPHEQPPGRPAGEPERA